MGWLDQQSVSAQFLREHSLGQKTETNCRLSYTSFSGGSYYVPIPLYDEFIDNVAQDITQKNSFFWNEIAAEKFPFFLDLDIEHLNEDGAEEFLRKASVQMCKVVKQLVCLNHLGQCIVARAPVKRLGDNKFKTGVHVHFPEVCVDQKTAVKLLLMMQKKLQRFTSLHLPAPVTQWSQIMDEKPLTGKYVSLRFYGANKGSKCGDCKGTGEQIGCPGLVCAQCQGCKYVDSKRPYTVWRVLSMINMKEDAASKLDYIKFPDKVLRLISLRNPEYVDRDVVEFSVDVPAAIERQLKKLFPPRLCLTDINGFEREYTLEKRKKETWKVLKLSLTDDVSENVKHALMKLVHQNCPNGSVSSVQLSRCNETEALEIVCLTSCKHCPNKRDGLPHSSAGLGVVVNKTHYKLFCSSQKHADDRFMFCSKFAQKTHGQAFPKVRRVFAFPCGELHTAVLLIFLQECVAFFGEVPLAIPEEYSDNVKVRLLAEIAASIDKMNAMANSFSWEEFD